MGRAGLWIGTCCSTRTFLAVGLMGRVGVRPANRAQATINSIQRSGACMLTGDSVLLLAWLLGIGAKQWELKTHLPLLSQANSSSFGEVADSDFSTFFFFFFNYSLLSIVFYLGFRFCLLWSLHHHDCDNYVDWTLRVYLFGALYLNCLILMLL